jgi:hypothetical protein
MTNRLSWGVISVDMSSFDALIDEFLETLNNPDLLVQCIRVHQHLDNVLTDLVNERLVESHSLDVQRIPFPLRVELAVERFEVLCGQRNLPTECVYALLERA